MGSLVWKVDIGYTTDIPFPTSLSQITFTDFDIPFSIIYGHSIVNNYELPYPDVGSYVESQLFEDSFVLYSFPITGIQNDLYNYIKNQVPSTVLAAPNLWSMQLDTTSNIYVFIYFKSSGKLIRANRGASVWLVSDGQLRYIYEDKTEKNIRFNSFQFDSTPPYIASFHMLVDNYTDVNSLIDGNWFLLRILIYGPSRSTNAVNASSVTGTWIKDWATALFVDNPPDYGDGGNPYEPGGPSGPGGGGGSFDNESDKIEDSSLPTLSSANTGFTRIYNPSLSQVQNLARYLWTDTSVMETIWNHIKQYFEDPMQAIIGFNLVPVPVPNGGTQNFALMYIDTGVQMTVAASQFVDVDCGTLEIKEYYGSALDYAPNTKISCFLPFIGTVSLNTDEVMGRTLQVKYRVDICSGSCVAKIAVDGNYIYQYSGHCAINIPISSADFSSYVTSAISVAQLAAGAIAAGAAGALAVGAEDAVQQTNQVVTTTQITNTARNPATGRQITTGTTTRVETREAPSDQSSTQASFSGLSPQNISNTVGQIMTSKPSVNHSGSFSGNSGYLGVRRPFVIIERPNMCMPANFQTLNGFPSMISLPLSDCKGFTRIQQIQLTGVTANNPEQAEILQLLKSGVIL